MLRIEVQCSKSRERKRSSESLATSYNACSQRTDKGGNGCSDVRIRTFRDKNKANAAREPNFSFDMGDVALDLANKARECLWWQRTNPGPGISDS